MQPEMLILNSSVASSWQGVADKRALMSTISVCMEASQGSGRLTVSLPSRFMGLPHAQL